MTDVDELAAYWPDMTGVPDGVDVYGQYPVTGGGSGVGEYEIHLGDCVESMKKLEAGSVQTCITSPPYYSLRDYGMDGQIGLEETPEAYVAKLVEVFREVKRLLRDDGTLWLNLGDSYAGSNKGVMADGTVAGGEKQRTSKGTMLGAIHKTPTFEGIKPKDLIGIPWRVAFALQADGWWLRSAITWCKGNPMPESVTDRPTKATEMLFLLTKSQTYYYDNEAVREPASESSIARISQPNFANQKGGPKDYRNGVNPNRSMRNTLENFAKNPGRNMRDWWVVNTQPYKGSHFATMPTKLVEPCILAGTSAHGACAACGAPWQRVVERESWNVREERRGLARGDAHIGQQQRIHNTNGQTSGVSVTTTGWQPTCTCNADVVPCTVLDCFNGAATTGVVALKHGRRYIGLELNPDYVQLSHERLSKTQMPLFVAT